MASGFKLPNGGSLTLLEHHISLDRTARGPHVVAGIIAFLVSEDAAHINGEALRVGGGVLS
jgi:NAD(P)-dependent dehydrogenase (short-subunit alcohol dehydrogenase family)